MSGLFGDGLRKPFHGKGCSDEVASGQQVQQQASDHGEGQPGLCDRIPIAQALAAQGGRNGIYPVPNNTLQERFMVSRFFQGLTIEMECQSED